MRRITTLLLLLAVACGAEGGGSQAAGSCEEIADDMVAAVNEVIAETGDLSLEEFAADAADNGEEAMQLSPELESRMEALGTRAEDAGCGDDVMTPLIQERADDIEGDGFLAEMIRGVFREGESFDGTAP